MAAKHPALAQCILTSETLRLVGAEQWLEAVKLTLLTPGNVSR